MTFKDKYTDAPAATRDPALKNTPRRFRFPVGNFTSGKHPNGSKAEWYYGCYFPQTDLCVGEMLTKGTGAPKDEEVEWLDE